MNNNVVAMRQPRPMPDDFAAILRDLADKVDAGSVTSFVGMWVCDGVYEFTFPSSLNDSLVLATLLQQRAAAKFLEPA